jgi:hypothetical protein
VFAELGERSEQLDVGGSRFNISRHWFESWKLPSVSDRHPVDGRAGPTLGAARGPGDRAGEAVVAGSRRWQ